jgi:2-iminobutanoate/2-iminopropanoate deaminase
VLFLWPELTRYYKQGETSMKKIITTDKAPGAIGPYSQGTSAQGTVIYTSGQLPLNTADGKLELDDIKKATKYSMENCKAILEAAGAGLEDVVKTLVFLTDMGEFAAMNEVYATFFPSNPPARSCIQVAALPKGAKIEVEMMALK